RLYEGQFLLIQPRRLAARAAASRLATLLKTKLGSRVGYHVRFDRRVGEQTQLISMTTGMLLRRLQRDPLLEDVGCVILDEFHERTMELDLSLGMLKRIRSELRPELGLVVMSATLDPEPIARFLGDAVCLQSEGRAFPVQIDYLPSLGAESPEVHQIRAIKKMVDSTDGHVLIFLPGVSEIRRLERLVRESGIEGKHCVVHTLYGDLSPKQQDQAIADEARRKLILSTNVAETSITIPGTTGVIDTGTARVLRFDSRVGLPSLSIEPISVASADQRAGRAGRTRAGICYRLWSKPHHASLSPVETPEIQRADFASAALVLASWGERDAADFPWLSAPHEDSIRQSLQVLQQMGVIDSAGGLTDIGQAMVHLPLHPRLARFMVAAHQYGISELASIAAALLTERDPFRRSDRNPQTGRSPGRTIRRGGTSHDLDGTVECDLYAATERMAAFQQGRTDAVANSVAAQNVLRVAEQLRRPMDRHVETEVDPEDPSVALRKCLLQAFADRVARRRQAGSDRGVMVGGRGVRLDRKSRVSRGDYFLCLNVDSAGKEASVRMASRIEREWLDEDRITESIDHFFHPSTKTVVARRRLLFIDLLLEESPAECEPSDETSRLLFAAAKSHFKEGYPRSIKPVEAFVSRVQFLAQHASQFDLPVLDRECFDRLLESMCHGRLSLAEVERAAWLDHLRGLFSFDQLQIIDREMPTQLALPSGNTVAIDYDSGRPVVKVKLQELFGLSQTPCIAGGKVPIQLHLLGPNYRPQQVTDDLQSFWSTTYQVVRKELRRRYPKHHWPENPLSAMATKSGLRRHASG
ncbi:MAG: ATP-dependent helicase C-terminal domain-containing protein, partial [Planctomycetota bacterium]